MYIKNRYILKNNTNNYKTLVMSITVKMWSNQTFKTRKK